MTTRIITATAVSLLVGLGSGRAAAGDLEFSHDDGTGAFTIGPSQFDAVMTWLNAFETSPGGAVIDRILVQFGDTSDNSGNTGPDAVTIGVLDDPNNDGDPTDAVLLTTAQGTWTDAPFGKFLEFDVPGTLVRGSFFVAVEMDVIERANPARMDDSSPTAGTRSWLFYNGSSRLDDLGNSKFILRMSDSPFLGAWMIRAQGCGACPADLTGDGSLDFADASSFLGAFAQGDPRVDFDGSGSLDFADVSGFLAAFAQGCP